MMSVTSGLPGAGKTLWTIAFVEALRKKTGREVYYHGIKELTLDWKPLADAKKWFDCPAGSIIVIDEAQHHFPMRGTSQAIPEHVRRTATHRHDGYDLFLITQHPGKLDPALRKDVEVHRHLMRKFGSHFATVHQWQGIRENCDKSRKDSIASNWRYPKEVFGWYKSAEVHTHKLSVPPKVLMAVAFIVLVAVAWFYWIGKMKDRHLEDAPPASSPDRRPAVLASVGGGGTAESSKSQPKTAFEYALERQPRFPQLQHTAPVYDGLTQPKDVPRPAACVQSESQGCRCFTQQATPYPLPVATCRQIVREGIFIDWDVAQAPSPSHSVAGDNTGPQSAE